MNRNIIRHELLLARRGWLIASGVTLLFMAIFASVADIYMKNNQIIELMKQFPAGLMEGFGVHIHMLTSFEGWMSGEPYTFFVMLLGAFGLVWSSSSISKERDRQTSELLFSLPYSRASIYFSKVAANFAMVASIYICSVLAVLLFGELFSTVQNGKLLLVVYTGGYLIALAFTGIGFALTSFLQSERSALTAGVGIVIVSFLLNMLAGMNDAIKLDGKFQLVFRI